MHLLLAALLVFIGVQDTPPVGTGSVEGVVTRAGTSQPVANASVVVFKQGRPSSLDFGVTTETDGNGHFVVSNMPAGNFRLDVKADGYLPYPLPNRVSFVILSDGQHLRQDVVLSATSAINGRIVDDNREPLEDVSVDLLRQSRDFTGMLSWQVLASTVTDEKGSYAFQDVQSGDSFVRATRKADQAMTYFPGTLDSRAAAPISLRDGDVRSADFSLAKGKTFSIAGTIKNADQTQVRGVTLYVLPRDSGIPLDESFTKGVPVEETFELKGLLPGAYDLFAVSLALHRNTSLGRLDFPTRGAKGFVQIRDEDVRDLSLVLEAGGDVSGHLKVVGGNTPPPRFRLLLKRRDGFPSGVGQIGMMVQSDVFKFADLAPGGYDISAQPLQGGAYASDVRAAGRSIVEEGLTVAHEPIDSVEILIELDGGTIKGNVTSTKKSAVLVVLAPQGSPRNADALVKAAGLEDSSESFTFSGVAPGLYSLFAIELKSMDEAVPVLSPEFRSAYQNRGVPIRVEKGATVTTAPLSLISR
jgi:hypothetical protein